VPHPNVQVHPVYRLFPCLALAHQEDLEMQRLCVAEWTRATHYFEEGDPVLAYNDVFRRCWSPLRLTCSNFETVKQYGRFPERNALLGRTSTNAEVSQDGARLGFLLVVSCICRRCSR
jgi:uncharacterized protein (DUF924 family)